MSISHVSFRNTTLWYYVYVLLGSLNFLFIFILFYWKPVTRGSSQIFWHSFAISQEQTIGHHSWNKKISTLQWIIVLKAKKKKNLKCIGNYGTCLPLSFTTFVTFSPGWKKRHTLKCSYKTVPGILTYIFFLLQNIVISKTAHIPTNSRWKFHAPRIPKLSQYQGTFLYIIWVGEQLFFKHQFALINHTIFMTTNRINSSRTKSLRNFF